MKKLLAALAAALLIGSAASAQITPPQVQQIGPNDLFQVIPNGAPAPGNVYAPSTMLGTYSATLSGGNYENALVGGDFGTNLFQRGTSIVLASPAAVAYSAADRFFVWGGTNTPVTSAQETAAADITPGYAASLRINKASGAGVVQVCVAQEVSTANSTRFQSQTAELDFHAKAGAGFSAASSNIAVYILTGTGTDEGSVNAAFSINGGGGGSAGWTGAAVLGGTNGYLIPINTGWARYSVVAPIPATATEIAVAICYTPVGTGTATDWFEFTGAQLVVNPALATVAGTAGAALGVNDVRAKSFARRPFATEIVLQQSYYYQITESKTALNIRGVCAMSTTSIANCYIAFPTTLRAAPTMTYTAGFTASATTASTSATVCTAVTTSATLTGNAATPQGVLIDCASSTGFGAAGTAGFLWDLGTSSSTGIIKASAEL